MPSQGSRHLSKPHIKKEKENPRWFQPTLFFPHSCSEGIRSVFEMEHFLGLSPCVRSL